MVLKITITVPDLQAARQKMQSRVSIKHNSNTKDRELSRGAGLAWRHDTHRLGGGLRGQDLGKGGKGSFPGRTEESLRGL